MLSLFFSTIYINHYLSILKSPLLFAKPSPSGIKSDSTNFLWSVTKLWILYSEKVKGEGEFEPTKGVRFFGENGAKGDNRK